MNTTTKQKEKGFTIIEVVLVLAIAALIFLMVFIALPALQRGQRDTQRKTDLGRIQTALTNYTGNNRGNLPGNWNTFVANYLTTDGDSFIDPSGPKPGDTSSTYVMTPLPRDGAVPSSFTEAQNTIYYTEGSACDGADGASVKAAGGRKVAFRMKLEGGGVICQNN